MFPVSLSLIIHPVCVITNTYYPLSMMLIDHMFNLLIYRSVDRTLKAIDGSFHIFTLIHTLVYLLFVVFFMC